MSGHEKASDLQFDAGKDRTYAPSVNTNWGGAGETARPWTREESAPMSTTHSTPVRVRVDRNLYVRPSGVYEAIYRDSSGKQRLKTLKATTLREARKELTALLGQRDRAEDVAPSRAPLNDLADAYFAEYEAKVTRGERSQRALDTARQRYDSHVRKTLGLRKAQEIRRASVNQWLADLRRTNLSNYTIRGIVTVLSAVFTRAVKIEAVQRNPVTGLDLPPAKAKTEPRVLTAAEIAKLIDSAPKRFVTLIAVACFTGMRQSEFLGLRWCDIDFEADGTGTLHVRNQLSRATRERPATLVPLKTDAAERSIELAPNLANELRRHLIAAKPEHSMPEGFVFCTTEGTPLYYRNVNTRALDEAAKRAGLNPEGTQKLSFHDLRHTAGSLLLDAGEDIVTVSRFMGHSKVSITLDIYAHQIERARGNGAGSRLGAVLGGAL